ncbi:MAG: hypothetical protein GY791_18450 [Alphaproteobacteria bacterium]|nr:hypothetical protein [Alphaproteobacteria bacterium]
MTVTSTPPPTGRKLAIGEIFSNTYGTCWRLIGKLPGVAAWPFLIAIVAFAVPLVMLYSPAAVSASTIFEIAHYLIMAMSYTLFAVAWHRLVLLASAAETSSPMAWRRRHTVFFGYQILLYVVMVVLTLPVTVFMATLVEPSPGGEPGISPESMETVFTILPIMFVALLVFYYVFFRLCFVFPACAVGERYGLADSWRHTRGNGWRLIIISILVNLAMVVVLVPVVSVLVALISVVAYSGAQGGDAAIIVSALVIGGVYTIAAFVALALNVTLISLSFRAATGWVPGPPAAAPAVWSNGNGGA